MQTLTTWLERPRVAWSSFALLLAVLAVVNGLDFPLSVPFVVRETGHNYLDMCAFWSAEEVQAGLAGLGERGRLLQALLFSTIDIVIPLLSCLVGLSAIASLQRGRTPRRVAWDLRRSWWFMPPLLALALDWTENALILKLLLDYPHPNRLLAALEGLFSGLKFLAYGLVVLTMACLIVRRTICIRWLRCAEEMG